MKRFETFCKDFYVDYRFLGLFDEVLADFGVGLGLLRLGSGEYLMCRF